MDLFGRIEEDEFDEESDIDGIDGEEGEEGDDEGETDGLNDGIEGDEGDEGDGGRRYRGGLRREGSEDESDQEDVNEEGEEDGEETFIDIDTEVVFNEMAKGKSYVTFEGGRSDVFFFRHSYFFLLFCL